MPRKPADHLREVVNNAKPVAPDGDGRDGSPSRPPPDPLPPGCPVIPLGMGDNVRHYLNAQRQLVTLAVKEHTRLQILGLFCGDADLVHEYWAKKKTVTVDRGKPTERQVEIVTGWDTAAAEMQLLRLTGAKGILSTTEKVRGRGCWLAPGGELVVNIGSDIIVDGKRRRPGIHGDHILVAREAIMGPAPTTQRAGAAGVGAELLTLLETWNWRRKIDARLLLGWIVCSFYGAALAIRPVGWIVGPKATGKSTLQTAIVDMLGGWMLGVLDPTPAAIWQTLKYDCLPIGIDEAEATENNARLNELVRLARLCFSGGKLPRGGSDGEASEYMLRSAVLFSSIRQPALMPQDQSRMIVMRLDKLPADQGAPDLSPSRLRALGARLLKRAIDGWPRFADTLEQYRIALKAVGHEGRTIEVFGSALAAADLVLSDDPPDTDSAAQLAAQLDFASLPEAEDDLADEQAWLARLLSMVIPLDGVRDRNTVAAFLRAAVKNEMFETARQEAGRVLGFYGIKIIRHKDGRAPEHFAIANRHPGLERLHEGTHWAGRSGAIGGWKQAARDLPGANETTLRFSGVNSKGTAIPLKLVFPNGYDDTAAAPAPLRLEAEP